MGAILIAGVPRSGKSTIARLIAHELGMSYFPVDALVSSLGTLYPELGITHLTYERTATVLDAYQCFRRDLHSAARTKGTPIASGTRAGAETGKEARDVLRVIYVGYPHALPEEKVARIRRYARGGDWTEELDDVSLTAIVERYVPESRAVCRALVGVRRYRR